MQIIRRTGEKRTNPNIQLTLEIEPEEYEPKPVDKIVCTFDTETDPFLPGRIVKPFTCGFYVPQDDFYIDFWGDDCVAQFFVWVSTQSIYDPNKLMVLVHNGGNFDFYFFVEYFDKGHLPFIINGRLVKIFAQGIEFRDSYAMIPVALAEYEKDKIDYRCMERGFREVFKEDIRHYQKKDCVYLAELATQWYEMFGNKLTMASVALPMLGSSHGFEIMDEATDRAMRPYYYGGRNQCFGVGIQYGNFKVYDINSSYPNVMRKYKHPISDIPRYTDKITERSHFAHIRAWSLGALPIRGNGDSLSFPVGTFDFFACMHEIRAGIETGTLKIRKVYGAIEFAEETNFAEFIDKFYELRMEAKQRGDKVKTLFYKLVMNSSYGKFAQDPRRYSNWIFDPAEMPKPYHCQPCYKRIVNHEPAEPCENCNGGTFDPYGWYLHTTRDNISIYASPQQLRPRSFFNVATAASITSAARAELLRGIQASTRPIYCDTDSIICEHLEAGEGEGAIRLDPVELGAWDCEAEGDKVCIAGKKLYAIFKDGELIKKASKGVTLSGNEILRICNGEVIEYAHPVPKFSLGEEPKFTTRRIKVTA